MPLSVVLETNLSGLTLARRGKVRDVYDLGEHLLIVATDRISAFDYVLGSGIPDKGKVLTQLSAFWFEKMAALTPHHLLSVNVDDFPAAARRAPRRAAMAARCSCERRCRCRSNASRAGICRVRAGRTTRRRAPSAGFRCPHGLRESDRFAQPIFTPATKAESGHDENISEAEAGDIVGAERIARLRDLTLAIYQRGVEHAETCGIIIADTKFEFGLARRSADGAEAADELVLIDEVLTPDSSRFWPKADYRPGQGQPSFDKQFVRDYLERIGWNKQPPVPSLPDDVVMRTREKYVEAYKRLTGQDLK